MTTAADVHLAEYNKLKEEQNDRIKTRDNLTYLTIGAAVAAVAGALQAHSALLLLALPVVSAALGWKYIANDQKVSAIGAHLRTITAPRLEQEVGEPVLGWETAHRNDARRRMRMRVQLGADLLTFAVPPAAGIVVWAVLGPVNAGGVAAAVIGVGLVAALVWQLVLHAEVGSRCSG